MQRDIQTNYTSHREATELDFKSICDWVNTNGELGLISGEQVEKLTPEILTRWQDTAHRSFVLVFKGQPVAFATCSSTECELPDQVSEICHLIVAPSRRTHGYGSFLCSLVANKMIIEGVTKSVIGRVVPSNTAALKLMKSLGWKEINGKYECTKVSEFRWFEASLV